MTTRQAISCTGRNAERQSRQSSIWCGRKTIQLLAILSMLFILLPDVGIQFRKGDIAEFTETPPPHTADCNLNLSSMEKVKCTPFRSISSSTFKCSFHFDAIVVAENFWDTLVLVRIWVGLGWYDRNIRPTNCSLALDRIQCELVVKIFTQKVWSSPPSVIFGIHNPRCHC